MWSFDDKVAVITGAGQGLGAFLAKSLASEGCHLVLCDIKMEGLEKTKAEVESKTDRRVVLAKTDVTSEEDVKGMVKAGVDEFSRLDFLVASAAMSFSGPLFDIELDVWRRMVDVNLFGYFLCVREVAKVMVENMSGAIVQINSRTGKRGSARNSAYSASKGGGIALTQSLSAELAESNVRVNCVCPGPLFESDLWQNVLFADYGKRFNMTKEQVKQKYIAEIPQKRACTYQDVSDLVSFLLSDKSSHMTGQAVNITGGSTVW